jgi:hypothetical protein
MSLEYEPDCKTCERLESLESRTMTELVYLYSSRGRQTSICLANKRYMRRLARVGWLRRCLSHFHLRQQVLDILSQDDDLDKYTVMLI